MGGRGLKGMLAKSRRVRDDATGEASPIREASDAVLSKIKSRIGSIDDDEPHDGKLSKLLTKRKERKRQKEMDSDGYRGRPGERNTPTSATMGTSGSLGNLSGQEEESSLLTSESEEET